MAQQQDLGLPPEESDGDSAVIASPSPALNTSSAVSKSMTPSTPIGNKNNAQTGNTPSTPTPTGSTPLQRTYTFDHARCQDCSFGYLKTCDCTNHLSALQKQSQDANDRLQQLVEMRERVYEEAEKLIAAQGLDPSSIGAGAKSASSSGGSFSEMFTGRKGTESPAPGATSSPALKGTSTASPTPLARNTSGNNLMAGIAEEQTGEEDDHNNNTWTEVDSKR